MTFSAYPYTALQHTVCGAEQQNEHTLPPAHSCAYVALCVVASATYAEWFGSLLQFDTSTDSDASRRYCHSMFVVMIMTRTGMECYFTAHCVRLPRAVHDYSAVNVHAYAHPALYLTHHYLAFRPLEQRCTPIVGASDPIVRQPAPAHHLPHTAPTLVVIWYIQEAVKNNSFV